jgi:hypothetical protein
VNSVPSDFKLPYDTVLAPWARDAAELREGDGRSGMLPRAMVDHAPWTREKIKNRAAGPIGWREIKGTKIFTRMGENNNKMESEAAKNPRRQKQARAVLDCAGFIRPRPWMAGSSSRKVKCSEDKYREAG